MVKVKECSSEHPGEPTARATPSDALEPSPNPEPNGKERKAEDLARELDPSKSSLHLFEGYGVEVELMIVDAASLRVKPIADRLLEDLAGEPSSCVVRGPIAWSNELALHVIELKSNGPTVDLALLAAQFQRAINEATSRLARYGATLLPTGMHPLMDPLLETRLWPHDDREIYEAFNRIFDCRGHGWSNLQSVHLNLPFTGDEEFGRLHAAIRLVLPILPMLAASSPLVEGRLTGTMDNRLRFYRDNCRRLPSVTGMVVPEPIFDQSSYQREIYDNIASALNTLGEEEILDPIWVNARGAIARFDRGSIEVRLLDTQESPVADIAIVAVVSALIRALVEERWTESAPGQRFETAQLASILNAAVEGGSETMVVDSKYLECLGLPSKPIRGRELWGMLLARLESERLVGDEKSLLEPVMRIVQQGCLAHRIIRRLGREPSESRIAELYAELEDCLGAGHQLSSK